MSRGRMLAVVAYACSALALAADEPAHVPLDEAVRTGLVEVELKGRGACSGDAVLVEVRRKVSHTVHIVVVPGTIVESSDGTAQSMVCQGVKYQQEGSQYRRVDVMVLHDELTHTFLLEAFCRDFSKATPQASHAFAIGTTDVQATKVILKGKKAQVSIRTIQAAVWLQRGVPPAEIRQRFRATDVELRAAGLLIQSASATRQGDTAVSRRTEDEVRVQIAGLFADLESRLANRPFRHGDKVQVTAESTPVRTLRHTLGTARQGDTFEVIAVFPQSVSVDFQPDVGGRPVRGLIAIADLKLADNAPRGSGRPILRELGALVTEAELEVITIAERGF